jgi:hypothetical protein
MLELYFSSIFRMLLIKRRRLSKAALVFAFTPFKGE